MHRMAGPFVDVLQSNRVVAVNTHAEDGMNPLWRLRGPDGYLAQTKENVLENRTSRENSCLISST
jgi:hypothetical protein